MNYTELMRRFGECNHEGIPVYQPGECIDATYIDGQLTVVLDCYTFLDDSGGVQEFDVDKWNAQKLVLTSSPTADIKTAWYEAFRLARALRSGFPIQLGDQQPFTMMDWVARCNASLSTPKGWETKKAIAHKRAFRIAAALPRRSIARMKKRIDIALRRGEALDPLMAWVDQNLSRARHGAWLLRPRSLRQARY